MNLVDLSKDQSTALCTLNDWMNSNSINQCITLGGYAGTGKTTLISLFRSQLDYDVNVAFLAFTGKATSVLRNKLIKLDGYIRPGDYVGTIHSFLYKPVLNEKGEIIDFVLKHPLEIPAVQLIIIDESSMVTEEVFNNLKDLEIPMICLGDHGQLPPVNGGTFNLMKDPDIKLEKIHRYGENNELMNLSFLARMEGKIPYGRLGNNVIKVKLKDDLDKYIAIFSKLNNYICLCGSNRDRVLINKQFRRSLGLDFSKLQVNDHIICLQNNNRSKDCPIYNGMTGVITAVKSFNSLYDIRAKFDGEDGLYYGLCPKKGFHLESQPNNVNILYSRKDEYIAQTYDPILKIKKIKGIDRFDYGYCITVHKSQGSEWQNVLLYEGDSQFGDEETNKRWLYTAVTRCRGRLIILGVY